jgi:hypothetical protein
MSRRNMLFSFLLFLYLSAVFSLWGSKEMKKKERKPVQIVFIKSNLNYARAKVKPSPTGNYGYGLTF